MVVVRGLEPFHSAVEREILVKNRPISVPLSLVVLLVLLLVISRLGLGSGDNTNSRPRCFASDKGRRKICSSEIIYQKEILMRGLTAAPQLTRQKLLRRDRVIRL